MRVASVALALALLLGPAAGFAAGAPYLFERLRSPAYHAAFVALFHGQADVVPWVREYLRNRDGVDTPGSAVAGGQYELYETCQPHNCAGNFLYTLFLPGGRKAWALLTRDGGDFRFFGNPGPPQRALLAAAAKRP